MRRVPGTLEACLQRCLPRCLPPCLLPCLPLCLPLLSHFVSHVSPTSSSHLSPTLSSTLSPTLSPTVSHFVFHFVSHLSLVSGCVSQLVSHCDCVFVSSTVSPAALHLPPCLPALSANVSPNLFFILFQSLGAEGGILTSSPFPMHGAGSLEPWNPVSQLSRRCPHLSSK